MKQIIERSDEPMNIYNRHIAKNNLRKTVEQGIEEYQVGTEFYLYGPWAYMELIELEDEIKIKKEVEKYWKIGEIIKFKQTIK